MKKALILGLVISFFAANAFAATHDKVNGQYGNHCAMGLVKGLQVATDCSINWTDTTTNKTYCFSSEAMKTEWAANTKHFITAADASYSGMMAKHDAMNAANNAMKSAQDAMNAGPDHTMHK